MTYSAEGAASYYRVTRTASTGAVTVTPVEVEAKGDIVGVSPDLGSVVVMEFQTANPGVPVDESRLSRWENWPYSSGAEPSLEDLTRLARTFGPPSEEFYDAEDLPIRKQPLE